MTPEEKKRIKEDFTEVYCSLSTEEQRAVITCTNAAIPTEDGAVIPAEYVAELVCHLHELWKPSPEKLAEANREALYWRAKINTISEVWKKYQEIEKEMKDNETCNS